eukprot:579204-Rhodomonas_salina.2
MDASQQRRGASLNVVSDAFGNSDNKLFIGTIKPGTLDPAPRSCQRSRVEDRGSRVEGQVSLRVGGRGSRVEGRGSRVECSSSSVVCTQARA